MLCQSALLSTDANSQSGALEARCPTSPGLLFLTQWGISVRCSKGMDGFLSDCSTEETATPLKLFTYHNSHGSVCTQRAYKAEAVGWYAAFPWVEKAGTPFTMLVWTPSHLNVLYAHLWCIYSPVCAHSHVGACRVWISRGLLQLFSTLVIFTLIYFMSLFTHTYTHAWMPSLICEVRGQGVGVNCLLPGGLHGTHTVHLGTKQPSSTKLSYQSSILLSETRTLNELGAHLFG